MSCGFKSYLSPWHTWASGQASGRTFKTDAWELEGVVKGYLSISQHWNYLVGHPTVTIRPQTKRQSRNILEQSLCFHRVTMRPLPLPGCRTGQQEAPGTQKYGSSSVLGPGDSVVRKSREDTAHFSFVIQAKVGHTVPMLPKVLVCGELQQKKIVWLSIPAGILYFWSSWLCEIELHILTLWLR